MQLIFVKRLDLAAQGNSIWSDAKRRMVYESSSELMVCLVTGKNRVPSGNIVYNYVHRREDMHYGCWALCLLNHVAGLVNSANDLLNHAWLPNLA